ncbi:MAG: hypothetical protein COA53_06250 [Rhodobacteraceae bacterium]|nr:MAG: hypothetical protein COA53_06250 [Paracoccaceae bacterium]
MNTALIIFILSFIAFAMLNNYFLKNDYEYQRQSKEYSLLRDPLGIGRFKRQPKKMLALMAVLFGPIGVYKLVLTLTTG